MHAPLHSIATDDAAIHVHIQLLHKLASSHWDEDGVLVLFGVGEDPKIGRQIPPRVEHFEIGDVQGMVHKIKEWSRIPHLNIYAPWALFRRDLARGRKGTEQDVVAVLAFVADMDNDSGKGGELPLEAPYTIETSSGNFQAVFPLSHALTADEAKPIAMALADAVGCDQRTKDVSGVWRVPGLLNYPNKKKIGRGRSADPQRVRVALAWTGDLVNPDVLADAVRADRALATMLPADASPGESDRDLEELLAAAGEELCRVIGAPPEAAEDRSETAFKVIARLAGKGFTDLEIQRLFEANPEGVGERYAEGKDLAADIRRVREKRAKSRGDAQSAFDDLPPTTKGRAQHPDGPLPLFPPLPPPERYPIEALGPVLSPAAQAIARKVQVPEAIAAQSILAVAALAAQPIADVLMPYGQSRPLSLNLITVAGSGDRKSTADNEALEPVHRYEAALKAFYDDEIRSYSVAFAAWNAEKKKIESSKMDYAERKQRIADLGPEPAHPLRPTLTVSNLTIEGLLKTWVHAPAALGVFTAEGGQFTRGHGMSEDRRLETAGIYSELWDGKAVKRLRALDGALILYGRRLAIHLMIQPEAASAFLVDPLLRPGAAGSYAHCCT